MPTTNDKPVRIDGTIRIKGFAHGLRFPSLITRVSVAIPPSQRPGEFARLSGHLESLFQSLDIDFEEIEGGATENVGSFLLHWMSQICQAGDAPVYEKGVLISDTDTHCALAMPVFETSFPATTKVLNWLVGAINTILGGKDIEDQGEIFSALVVQLKQSGPEGLNTPRFLRAAFEADIPTAAVAGGVIQYGQGARARWLNSSFTDRSSVISATLTRNKDLTSKVLRQAGLPVAANILCSSADDAIKVADKMGYPVVIKPADKDGGVAVAAGLTTEDEIRTAFSVASSHTDRILVEKHVVGRDYRLNVLNGELLWAIERIPAGVTGDGQSTIRQLIDQTNTDPRRSTGKRSLLKLLVLDEDSLTVLKNNGREPNDVPGEGEFVPLRRNANISTGGTPVAVMDEVHPDNRSLAIRAAAALRLDLAGIDIICGDISRSWKESGAAICEVNGQPQLGGVTCPQAHAQVLETLVEGNGRIPIAVVLGAPPGSALVGDLHSCLQRSGAKVGLADQSGITVGKERILDGDVNSYSAGQMLIRDSAVEVAIIDLSNTSAVATGLPFDRFDILVIAGRHMALPRDVTPQQHNGEMQNLFKMLLLACTGKVIVPKDLEKKMGAINQWTSAEWVSTDSSQAQLSQLIADELVTAAGTASGE